MNYGRWKKIKRSGAFRRKVKKIYTDLKYTTSLLAVTTGDEQLNNINVGSVSNRKKNTFYEISKQSTSACECSYSANVFADQCSDSGVNRNIDNFYVGSESEDSYSSETNVYKHENLNDEFRSNFRDWALQFNIPHNALKKLSSILNERISNLLPRDPRTILKTNTAAINVFAVGSGFYWHGGFTETLKEILEIIQCDSDVLNLLINIDGLPVYKSSKMQFWPILCKIIEIPRLSPLVFGIYAGHDKPSDLDKYLEHFVDEMKSLESGLKIKTSMDTEKIFKIKIKAFVCDSPARAMIKGVANFNSKHGCLKCTTVGEYSHNSHTVVFSKEKYPARTNDDFRAKRYGDHHKRDSPLLKLNIDMVEDFPVSDSLHLIDLGVMKRLLLGWRDGKFGKHVTKWRAQDIEKVAQFLLNCKTPKEIHRSTRAIDVLAFWKASEFRTFLYYLSFVVLKDVLCSEAYQHFLCFFCATTICSSEQYFHFLDLAEKLLAHFVENFHKFYSKDYITSNIHNLTHMVSEVKRFGKLQNYNAYPFENKLYSIKKLIRQGNNPLAQVARRLSEKHVFEIQELSEENTKSYPQLIKNKSNKLSLRFPHFLLSSFGPDKWFLDSKNHIIEIEDICFSATDCIIIRGNRILGLSNVFDIPINSSFLNIFKCDINNINKMTFSCEISDVMSKVFAVTYNNYIYFSPLLHTL